MSNSLGTGGLPGDEFALPGSEPRRQITGSLPHASQAMDRAADRAAFTPWFGLSPWRSSGRAHYLAVDLLEPLYSVSGQALPIETDLRVKFADLPRDRRDALRVAIKEDLQK